MSSLIQSSGLTGFAIPTGAITAIAAASALTISIVNAQTGVDPTPNSPIYVAVPSSDGSQINKYIIGAALQIVLHSGSTLAQLANQGFRIYLIIVDDDGTVRLGAGCMSKVDATSNIFLDASSLSGFGTITTTAEGGGSALSAGVIYTTVAATSKPYRIIGYLDYESGLASPGVWATAPDKRIMAGPLSFRPHEIVQTNILTDRSGLFASTIIPLDNTKPQKTEGNPLVGSLKITPRSPINLVHVRAIVNILSDTAGVNATVALFKDSETDARAANTTYLSSTSGVGLVEINYLMVAGQITEITFALRLGPSVAATLTVNPYFNLTQWLLAEVREIAI